MMSCRILLRMRNVVDECRIENQNTHLFVIKPTRCTDSANLFWHEYLHVSESSSAHHQEFVHCALSNGICHTGL